MSHTQPHVQRVTGTLSPHLKRPRRETEHLHSSNVENKTHAAVTYSPLSLKGLVLNVTLSIVPVAYSGWFTQGSYPGRPLNYSFFAFLLSAYFPFLPPKRRQVPTRLHDVISQKGINCRTIPVPADNWTQGFHSPFAVWSVAAKSALPNQNDWADTSRGAADRCRAHAIVKTLAPGP